MDRDFSPKQFKNAETGPLPKADGEGFYLKDHRPKTIAQLKPDAGAATATKASKSQSNLPAQLKNGIEGLSGLSMDDVKVHYNSDKPAQLQAHAYAQGTDIHLAPGQEKHLPHEAWHVVQQKQGRVTPTTQLKGNVNINDNSYLETEAGSMGNLALSHGDDFIQRKEVEGLACSGANLHRSPTIQRAIIIPRGSSIDKLHNVEKVKQWIAAYNQTYDAKYLDLLVQYASEYNHNQADSKSLKNLIKALDIETGNRDVVKHRVRLPRNINDANKETMHKNCALTSIAALLGKKKGSDVKCGFDDDAIDAGHQDSAMFLTHPKAIGGDDVNKQITGMLHYVIQAYGEMGFTATVNGGIKDNYVTMPANEGITEMKKYATGTKFLVYVSGRYGSNQMGHWLFADRYGSQVFFYDYQEGRVKKQIDREGTGFLKKKGGGASSPVDSKEPVDIFSAALFSKLTALNDERGEENESSPSSSENEGHVPRRRRQHASSVEPDSHEELPMPRAMFKPMLPVFDAGVSVPAAEMFFIAVIPHIKNRNILRGKLKRM